MLLFLSFLNGIYHGLGSDHLMAITTLASRGGTRRDVSLLGLRFSLGHMGTLILLAGAALVWEVTVPPLWESRAEALGGALLVVLGLWTFAEWLKEVGYAHSHTHRHGRETHSHLHFHLQGNHPHEHVHPHLSWALGALFALSGLRALLLSAFPVLQARSLSWALVYIAVFGIGIVTSMTIYGWMIGSALSQALRRAPVMFVLSGASIGLGTYWVWRSW